MDEIRTYFETFATMTDQDWDIFSSKLVQQNFAKKAMLLQAGKTENYLSFISKGAVRFYIPRAESEFTFTFSFANEFVSAYDSFLTRKPSSYAVEAMIDTTVWRISYPDLQEVYKITAIGNEIGRRASEDLFLLKTKRELDLLLKTAEERYFNLFTEQPQLIREIPLKYIASYIGVTPQALSRIRRRIT